MYRLLLNNEMSMCCVVLMIGSINLMLSVMQQLNFYASFTLTSYCNILLRQSLKRSLEEDQKSSGPGMDKTAIQFTSFVAGLLSHEPGFDTRWIHTRFMVDKVSWDRLFCCSSVSPSVSFNQYLSSSSYYYYQKYNWSNTENPLKIKKQRSFRCLETMDRKVFWPPRPPDFES